MNRRRFLSTCGVGIASLAVTGPLGTPPGRAAEPGRSEGLYELWVRANDELVPGLLERQEVDTSHRWLGGVRNEYGIHTPGGTAHLIKVLASAYCAPESRVCGDETLILPMERAAKYLLRAQHPDGTIDLYSTNFHSPPDTGFVVEPICVAAGILERRGEPRLKALLDDLARFLVAAGRALSAGGIHTPNHRWVVCMALARIHALQPQRAYLARIDEWLAEKIDIDPDGQFTERSTSIYSPLTDRCLVTVARLLDRPELLEPVRRNLEMTTFLVHPDGEVVTECSRRQDRSQRGTLAAYYYPYRYMALVDRNGKLAAMARRIEEVAADRLTGNLAYFLEDPRLKEPLPPSAALPESYRAVFHHSGLGRIRRGEISATVVARNPILFAFRKGAAVLEGVRLASAFFGEGQFEGDRIEIDDGKLILRQELTGAYYQPLAKGALPSDGDWHKMDRSLRRQTEVQHLRTELTVSEQDGRFRLSVDVRGTNDVPVALELGFRRGGSLEGVTAASGSEGAFLLEGGLGTYRLGTDTIRFGPGRAEHRWTDLRGALPKLEADSVYLTGFTPIRWDLTIE